MKQGLSFVCLLLVFFVHAQEKSNLKLGKRYQKIKFKLVNNLIIVPLELNGVEGDFILDTGVKGNIIFLGKDREFVLKDSLRTVNLKGFGYGEPVKAFISIGNDISYKKLRIKNKDFFILQDDKLNFSAKTGIAIHGLVGSDFFKNNVVKIDYKGKNIIVYDSDYFHHKKYKEDKVQAVDLVFHSDKPYMNGSVNIFENDSVPIDVKLLIDTGGTESLWLF